MRDSVAVLRLRGRRRVSAFDILFDIRATSLPQAAAGTIKAYAVVAKSLLTAAPNIPTVDKVRLPEFYLSQ
jgi:tripartite-type tricarboxylate transporter receptor subunit TctC